MALPEEAVRDDDLCVVSGADLGAAGSNMLDDAVTALHADKVVDADRPLHEEDEAANEVVHDVLAAETDPNGERAAGDGQCMERELHELEGADGEAHEEHVEAKGLHGCGGPGSSITSASCSPGSGSSSPRLRARTGRSSISTTNVGRRSSGSRKARQPPTGRASPATASGLTRCGCS